MIDFRVGYIHDDITIVCWNKIDLSAEEVCVISGQRDEVQFVKSEKHVVDKLQGLDICRARW